jgi:hypothetical protein
VLATNWNSKNAISPAHTHPVAQRDYGKNAPAGSGSCSDCLRNLAGHDSEAAPYNGATYRCKNAMN